MDGMDSTDDMDFVFVHNVHIFHCDGRDPIYTIPRIGIGSFRGFLEPSVNMFG